MEPKEEPIHYGMKEQNKVEGFNSFIIGNNPYQHIEHVNAHIEELDMKIENFKKVSKKYDEENLNLKPKKNE